MDELGDTGLGPAEGGGPIIIEGISSRIFTIDDSIEVARNVTISGLRLEAGNGVRGGDPDPWDGWGGAILNRESLTLENVTIDSNVAATGGGIANVGSPMEFPILPTAVIRNSTLSNNDAEAGSGGGIVSIDANLELIQSTVSGNTADFTGGGLACFTVDSDGLLNESSTTIQSSTIYDNYASELGGGIYTNEYHNLFAVNNSIIAGNSAGMSAADIDDIDIMPTYSLIGDNTGTSLAAANPDMAGNIVGDPGMGGVINPMLAPLADNGGPTQTHLPLDFSPAIDKGDNGSLVLFTDQRGFGRIVNGLVDMGSVEFGSTALSGDFNGDGLYDLNDIDLLVAALASGSNDLRFDLTNDAQVTAEDLDAWLLEAGEANLGSGRAYLSGDANLDGVVDVSDFNLWNTNKFVPTAAWSLGDFNADGFTDVSDFNLWNINKFTTSRPANRGADESVWTAELRRFA